jgi:hypothetical protein
MSGKSGNCPKQESDLFKAYLFCRRWEKYFHLPIMKLKEMKASFHSLILSE